MAAMNQKKDNWTSETLFITEAKTMVQKAAQEAFQEWLAANKVTVKTALKKYLSAKEGLIDNLVKQIMTGLIDHVSVDVRICTDRD